MPETREEKAERFYEVVSSICEAYVAQHDGQMPSMGYILSQTDEFKSKSTAHRHFLKWKEAHDARLQQLFDQTGFSDEFNQSMKREISRFASAAEKRYKQKAEDARSQTEEAVRDLEASEDKQYKQQALVDTLRQKITDLEKSQTELTSSSDSVASELRQQIAEQSERENDLIQRNERLQTELAKFELRMENNDKLVDEVKDTNKQLVKDNKQQEKDIIALNKTIATLETKLTGKDELIAEMKKP